MLEGIKRWLSGSTPGRQDGLEAFVAWAKARQYVLRTPRDQEGLIVEGKQGTLPWRLEWGASQRPYVSGREVRIRAELGLGSDLQVLVLNKTLQESIEKSVFDQYVEGVQTRIDTQTPPEMRWVVMFPKLTGSELGRLRERYAALGSVKPWLQQWLAGPLTDSLMAQNLAPATPWVLMIGRGRLTLRTELQDADPADFDPMLRLFEVAIREALRVAHSGGAAESSAAEN